MLSKLVLALGMFLASSAIAEPLSLDVIGFGRVHRNANADVTYPYEFFIPETLQSTPAERNLWNVLAQNLRLEKITWALMLTGYFHGYSDRFGDEKVYKEDWTLVVEPSGLSTAERNLFWGLIKKRYAYTAILKEYYLTMELSGASYDNYYISPHVLAIWLQYPGSLRQLRAELNSAAQAFFSDKP